MIRWANYLIKDRWPNWIISVCMDVFAAPLSSSCVPRFADLIFFIAMRCLSISRSCLSISRSIAFSIESWCSSHTRTCALASSRAADFAVCLPCLLAPLTIRRSRISRQFSACGLRGSFPLSCWMVFLEFDPLCAHFYQLLGCQFLIDSVTSGPGVRLEELLRGLQSITVAGLPTIAWRDERGTCGRHGRPWALWARENGRDCLI